MWKYVEIITTFLFLLSTANSKIVSTKSGDVVGRTINVLGQQIDVYLGIPYAVPPLGNLRFKPPNPVKPWDGIYNATRNPPSCMQGLCFELCSEDCLYLNVWAPSNVTNAAVMVWIYGGAFMGGGINQDVYNGSIISAIGNVIVASINYRVGAFGFLCSETDDARGNMGIKDQVLGIKWIKNNAKAFGGDPDKISLFGESAGAISVSAHMVSPLTKGLFKYAIMQSGSAYHPYMFVRNSSLIKTRSAKLAVMVSCSNLGQDIASDPKIMRCMKERSAVSILEAERNILAAILAGKENPWLSIFTPIYGDDYLPNSPVQEMASGNIHIDNFIIGNVRDEGSGFIRILVGSSFENVDRPRINKLEAAELIKVMFRGFYKPSPEDIVDYYLTNTSFSDRTLLKRTYDSIGDLVFNCPSVFLSEDGFAHGKSVYHFRYSHRWSRSPLKEWLGVVHGADVSFVFGMPFRNVSLYTPIERQFSKRLIIAWTSFAKKGTPTYRRLVDEWPEYENSRLAVDLNAYNASFINPYKYGCHFWKKYS